MTSSAVQGEWQQFTERFVATGVSPHLRLRWGPARFDEIKGRLNSPGRSVEPRSGTSEPRLATRAG